jgi:hypothetical protein
MIVAAHARVAGAAQADGRRYVPPITGAIVNESPYITTEIRPIYMYHWIPDSFVTNGGYAQIFAVQLRAAVTDRLAVIATKDGYADLHFDDVLPDDDGFVNIAAGLKYAVLDDADDEQILTIGLRYEAPTGNLESAGIDMQGTGDGLVDVFVTGATAIGDRAGVQASAGVNMALDTDNDSSSFHAAVHADYELVDTLFAVFETNLISTIIEGDRTDSSAVGSFEGFDVVNFGSTDSGTVVTLGFGARVQVTDCIQFGTAYEFAATDREDIFEQRLTFDGVFEF